jgi:hypothetical protein
MQALHQNFWAGPEKKFQRQAKARPKAQTTAPTGNTTGRNRHNVVLFHGTRSPEEEEAHSGDRSAKKAACDH